MPVADAFHQVEAETGFACTAWCANERDFTLRKPTLHQVFQVSVFCQSIIFEKDRGFPGNGLDSPRDCVLAVVIAVPLFAVQPGLLKLVVDPEGVAVMLLCQETAQSKVRR